MIDTVRFSIERITPRFKKILITFQDASKGKIEFYRYEDKKGYRHQKDYVKSHIGSGNRIIISTYKFSSKSAEWEFSIPKYVYGHNLEQYPLNKPDVIYELKEFFNKFIEENYQIKVPLHDIRILRLDICYNHHFDNTIQKHQHKKMIIQNGHINFPARNVTKYGNDTIMINYDHYSFKMYDKGAEFKKHDYLELCKDENFGIEETNKLQLIADKILRFEISYRKPKISDVFMMKYNELILPDLRLKKEIDELTN